MVNIQKIKAKGKIFFKQKYNLDKDNKLGVIDFLVLLIVNQCAGLCIGYFLYDYMLFAVITLGFINFLLWYNLTAINLIGYDTDLKEGNK